MNFFVFLLIFAKIAVSLSIIPKTYEKLGTNFIETHNCNKSNSWKAKDYGENFKFPPNLVIAVQTENEKKKLLKSFQKSIFDDFFGPSFLIPSSFDAEEYWPTCKFPVRDQGSCGSCYAMATTMILQTRMCIKGSSKGKYLLSPQEIVSCDPTNLGCGGGFTDRLFTYSNRYGVLSDDCYPYVNAPFTATELCKLNRSSICPAGGAKEFRKNLSNSGKRLYFMNRIQEEIMKNGPVVAYMHVFSDFNSYASGIYEHISGTDQGGHLITLVGWGNENGKLYWKVKNSWGPSWGENGYFRIARGKNEVDIESYVYADSAIRLKKSLLFILMIFLISSFVIPNFL